VNRLSPSRARDLLEKAGQVRILVVGDLMLDRYLTGTVDRISPEAPVPVVRVEEEFWAVGGAGNVAANVVALGAACDVVGCLGSDLEGRILQESLEGLGVGTTGVVEIPDRPTTVKTRIMARHQHVTRVDREAVEDIPDGVAHVLEGAMSALSGSAHGIILEDYNKGLVVSPVIEAALREGDKRGIPTVVDPKRMRFFQFQGATVFKPNSGELEAALGEMIQPDDPDWMEEVRSRLGCQNLLLTLGEEGMALRGQEVGYLRVPTVARDVYDVSGAGDTVTAVMATTLASGGSPIEGAVLASHAAAIEVGRAGVATVTPEEILQQHEEFTRKETT
jgi:D-beta-D-heptose 7-phosphate kinase/D-beta-D-heptose 1-phosphate adenosyltransferase